MMPTTAVLPVETMECSVVLFVESFSSSRSRPGDIFSPPKGNSLPAKGGWPVHDLVGLSEENKQTIHDHSRPVARDRNDMELWPGSELN